MPMASACSSNLVLNSFSPPPTMRNRLLLVLGVLAIALIGFCAFVAMQPSDVRISRSAHIAAAPEKVFEQVNSFHNWQHWSPWAKLDPDSKATFTGPEAGEGAQFAWDGNDQVGAGDMTIVGSKPHEQIDIKLHFIKPMEGDNHTLFTFAPSGEGTDVTWTMTGQNNFFGKLACLFIDMDQMLGREFDKGLASLAAIVETPAQSATATEPPPETTSSEDSTAAPERTRRTGVQVADPSAL
jgi:hypothetical protein